MEKALKYFLVIILLSCVTNLSYSQSNKNEFIVKGNIIALKDTVLKLTIWDSNAQNGTRYATIPVSGGRFEYRGSCEDHLMVRGWIFDPRVMKRPTLGGFYPVKSSNIWFIIYPGANVTINGTITDHAEAYPSDGGENDVLSLLTRELFPVLNESVNNLVSIKTDHRLTNEQISEREKEITKLDQKSVNILKSFIDKNASSVAALWFMNDMLMGSQIEIPELERFLGKVDPRYYDISYY